MQKFDRKFNLAVEKFSLELSNLNLPNIRWDGTRFLGTSCEE